MQIVLFEDALVTKLYPITVGRAAYNITCGSFRLLDWVETLAKDLKASIRGVVRPHLAEIQRVDFPQLQGGAAAGPTLFINARLAPSPDVLTKLRAIATAKKPVLIRDDQAVLVAYVGQDEPETPAQTDVAHLADHIEQKLAPRLPAGDVKFTAMNYPHDVVRANMDAIRSSLEWRLKQGGYQEQQPGLFVAPEAQVGPFLALDTSAGPILIDRGATIGPHCFLRGPIYIGPKCRVIEHSAIKDAVSLGHTTKIGGEVEASVVEAFTNKQHHGFLGHSYLGSWINLGAGTCNSDLKNTYGAVRMDYRGESVATGMQFVGCMIGDYSKSAINTGIFTGKTVGVCSMMYGFVTTNVPSFVNYARLFGQVTELPPEVTVTTQQRMFARRNVTPRPCDQQLIHAMYELTRHERQLAGEPLSL